MLQSKTSIKAKLWRAKRGAKKRVKAEKTRSHPARGGTKQDAVLALLRQPSGASIDAMMKAFMRVRRSEEAATRFCSSTAFIRFGDPKPETSMMRSAKDVTEQLSKLTVAELRKDGFV